MRIGVIGCAGRMGRTNLRELLAHPMPSWWAAWNAPGMPRLARIWACWPASTRSASSPATMWRP